MNADKLLLWADGVGGFLICLNERLTIGGPSHHGADISLFAELSREHAVLFRSGVGWFLEADAPAKVDGKPLHQQDYPRASLKQRSDVVLGENVKLKFRQPNPLSVTAVLTITSSHRPVSGVDGIILMEQNCLLGADAMKHVRHPDWPDVTLFRRNDELCFNSDTELQINGVTKKGGTIQSGDVVSGENIQFRIEEA